MIGLEYSSDTRGMKSLSLSVHLITLRNSENTEPQKISDGILLNK